MSTPSPPVLKKPTPPVPSFNEFEHLQTVLMRTFNKQVKEGFKDDIADDDTTTPEGALRYACLLKDNDNATNMLLRILLFNLVRGDSPLVKELADKFYAIPMLDYHRDVKFAPQIILKFKETIANAKRNNRQSKPVRMRISFRLPKLSEDSITESDLTQWSNKIKELFPKTFYHTIGSQRFSYKDSDKGLSFLIRGIGESDAVEFYRKMITLLEYVRATATSSYDKTAYRFDVVNLTNHKDVGKKPTKKIVDFKGLHEKYTLDSVNTNTKVYLYRAELHLHGRLVNKDLLFRAI
jgi:hypothetical protein